MNKKSGTSKDAADKLIKGIKRKTRKQYSAEGCCQTNSNQSPQGQDGCPLCRAETAPLGESSGAVQFVM